MAGVGALVAVEGVGSDPVGVERLGAGRVHYVLVMDETFTYDDVSSYTLDEADEAQLLELQNECNFMWTNKEGWPVGVIMSYVWRDGKFWLSVSSLRLRVRAVQRDPRVAISITSKGTPIKGSWALTYKGTCEVFEDSETIGWFLPELAKRLRVGDPAAQAEIIADASAAAELTPSATTNLRYGLILAIPGHPESNPVEAQRLLREVLAEKLLLTPAEIALATIHLNNAERQIVADTETQNLRLSTSRAAESQEQATYQRLSAVEAENRRLRRELAEAEQKLEAITSIERSISDQE